MKTIKGLMLGIMFSSTLLSFSVPAFATEESSTTASEASVTTETSVTKTKAIEEKKEIDITPKFKINEIKTTVSNKGTIEVEQVEGMTGLKGTFKATVADKSVLSINAQGQWQGLQAGKTTASLDFDWDAKSMKKIQEKYPNHQLIKRDIAQEVAVEVTPDEEKSVDITPKFNVGTINAKIGDTGQFKVAPMGGVSNPTGTYTAYIPDTAKDIISVDATGKWKALKTGTVDFTLDFKLSAESTKEIQDKNPGSTLTRLDIATMIKAEVKPVGIVDITPTIEGASIEGKVGDTGQLKVKPIEGIEDTTGLFTVSIQDPTIIEVDTTGKWKALKAGTTEVTIMYSWSDETMKKLAEKYPGYDFSMKEMAQVIKVTISEKTTGSTKPVGTTKPTGKQLPATNETSTNMTWIIGMMILGLAVVGWYKKESVN
ncbi:LPXTG-domain-containing protein cell wall anchor domain [Enterococcus moraviensis ATCC BAA-383]|uniref:LPXTG-domain-containing protein cell wall anchor domain n=1 Tax=Enterococcus moraviensis ATCC BAA-383 TaxID=1158609 RepID=R2SSI3_9ENTE|nr:LPXTG cell wall anchor domain-containing protein [Enterococcus moraviensis]EOH95756.1 LPXTG-domain-containing protein cell wall anchor domain [Enterococcus moraviensis ATCC BAA-383]EOT66243.1 hypothetical protein I586_02514 [Enterococcus moraviensis ATCC BAA-383]OJG67692.1 LPXTG-domain-containing protein cell wall anchor domain [Enterococcus moraviensis]